MLFHVAGLCELLIDTLKGYNNKINFNYLYDLYFYIFVYDNVA